MRHINAEIRAVVNADQEEPMTMARDMQALLELLNMVKRTVACRCRCFLRAVLPRRRMRLCASAGCGERVCGPGIFKSDNPVKFARAIVKATAHYDDPAVVLEASKELEGVVTRGTKSELDEPMKMANRVGNALLGYKWF